MEELRRRGVKAGLFRPVTLWPFPIRPLLPLLPQVRRIVVVEASAGQLEDEMKRKAQASNTKDAKAETGYVEYFKKAASYFERLTKVKPDDPNAWDFYASAAANAGMLKEAEAAIKKADDLRNRK